MSVWLIYPCVDGGERRCSGYETTPTKLREEAIYPARKAHTRYRYSRLASVDDFDWLMNINARGVMLSFKYAAQQMIKQGGGGKIIGSSYLKTPLPTFDRKANKGGCVHIGACSMAGKRGISVRFGGFRPLLRSTTKRITKHLRVQHVKVCCPWIGSIVR